MSNIKSARADYVQAGGVKAIVVSMYFENGEKSQFVLSNPLIIKSFDDDAESSLKAALMAVAATQGTPAAPATYDFDTVKNGDGDPKGDEFINEVRRVTREQVAIAEWAPKA